MKARSGAEMRELDRRAIQEFGIPGIRLMENAGAAVAVFAEELARPFRFPEFLLLAGKGNNGGDAFIAARILAEKGFACKLFLTTHARELSGDAAEAFRRLPDFLRNSCRSDFSERDVSPESVIVDGILGTGIKGAPRAPADQWIKTANASGQPVLSIDIPSGLDSETGEASCCVRADMTVTFAAYKRGMFYGKGPEMCGMVRLAPIGFPKTLLSEETNGDTELFTEYDFRELFRKDSPDTHKGNRGTALVAGGSSDYPGAPGLSAVSAIRGGAGIVILLRPGSVVAGPLPNAIIARNVPDMGTGRWTGTACGKLSESAEKADSIVFGPGLTADPVGIPCLKTVLAMKKPTVLDADGLNLIAAHPHLRNLLHEKIVLTPHPGEMKRLLLAFGLSPEGSRQRLADKLSRFTGCVVVLKGQHTAVASPDGRITLNTSGTAALATAGSGDCLSGLCGAFLANGYPPGDAARMAVFLHGRAAERAACAGTRGVIADDLPSFFTVSGAFL